MASSPKDDHEICPTCGGMGYLLEKRSRVSEFFSRLLDVARHFSFWLVIAFLAYCMTGLFVFPFMMTGYAAIAIVSCFIACFLMGAEKVAKTKDSGNSATK